MPMGVVVFLMGPSFKVRIKKKVRNEEEVNIFKQGTQIGMIDVTLRYSCENLST